MVNNSPDLPVGVPEPRLPVPAIVNMLMEAMQKGLESCPAMKYASGSDVISAIFSFTAMVVDGQLVYPGLTLEQRALVQKSLVESCEKLWKRAAGVAPRRKPDDTKGEIKTEGSTRLS